MNILEDILQLFFAIFTNVVFLLSLYTIILSLFGIIRFKKKEKAKPEKSFAMIVAAHNEEAVIADIIESLKSLNYPKELYEIFVIADNCTDKTAKIAKNKGAHVFQRFDNENRGKGFALDWMFKQIFKMDKKFDAVCVFDADNLVSKNYLLEMNDKLIDGSKVIQGYLDSKNPKDTWVTGAYSISFWLSNRILQLARSNIRLSNQLGGTGFCIQTDILKELGWGAHCLTEDLEFTCKLIMNNYKVAWAHDAVVYDEKPLTLKASWNQRKRWMQGYADVSSRYFWKLIKKSIRDFDLSAFDCALYSIQPITLILLGIAMVINIYNQMTTMPEQVMQLATSIQSANMSIAKVGVVLVLIVQSLYSIVILIIEKKLSPKILFYYLFVPIFSLTWVPICIQGILGRNEKEWAHTVHTRSVKISDLEKVN